MNKPKLLSKKEAANELGIDPKTLAKAIAKRQISTVPIGDRLLIPAAEIEGLIAAAIPTPPRADTPLPQQTASVRPIHSR
jgi:excisionase family DNA binding protein